MMWRTRTVMISLVGLGVLTVPAVAGSTHTPMKGTLGNPFNDGQMHGWGWNAPAGVGGGGGLGNLYDNILTANGGAATAGFFGPFEDIPGTQAFVDWIGTQAQWSDEMHNLSAGTGLPAVVQTIYYGYRNEIATTTHIIKLYDMVFPSAVPTFSTLIEKGALLASIALPANPTGTLMVTVTGLDIQVPQSAVWIKFVEAGPGFPGTFWLSGGAGNGVGFSHPGVVYAYKYSDPPGFSYNVWFPFEYFYFDGTGYVASNIQVALGGFHVPAPAVMSLLGVAGLVTLRRRRH